MRAKELKIIPVLNGYVVHAGCQTVVFESREKLIAELGRYYAKPLDTEKYYLKNAVNPMPEEPVACDPGVIRSPACADEQSQERGRTQLRSVTDSLIPSPAPYETIEHPNLRR